MADLSLIRGDVEFQGDVSFGGDVFLPAGTVTTSSFSSGTSDRLAYTKAVHYSQKVYYVAPSTSVASVTIPLHFAMGSGTISHVWINPMTAPTGGDKAYTVDVKKSSDGSATQSSVLSAVVTINSSDASDTQQAATVTTSTFASKDILWLVIATSGSTGTQGQGLVVTVGISEQPT